MEGGTRTRMGGFDKVVVDWGPEVEGLDAGNGRRMDPIGFFTAFAAAVMDLVSWRPDLGSERARLANRETNLEMTKQRQGCWPVMSQIWKMLCVV